MSYTARAPGDFPPVPTMTVPPTDRPRNDTRPSARWLVLVVALAYLFPFPHFEVLRSPNELSRLYQVRALVDDGVLHVNAQVKRYGRMGDLSERKGRMFPNKAPGISLLGAPVYAALRAVTGADVSNRGLLWVLRLTLCMLPTLLLLTPLRRWAARTCGDGQAADAAVLVFALGTLAMPYSLLFFSHQLSAVFAAASFLLLERVRHGDDRGRSAVAGLFAGLAVMTEYTLAPVAALLGLYLLLTAPRKPQAVSLFLLGALPCALGLFAYHQHAWGHPLSTGYQYVQNKTFASWHAQGFMGVAWPKLSSLAGNLFSPARGLFAFSPALLPAIVGLVVMRRADRAATRFVAALVAFYFFIAAAFLYQAWGWMLGPRHLTPLAPFLVAPLACAIAWLRVKQRQGGVWSIGSGVLGGLAAASIVVNATASAVYPHIPEEFSAAMAHLVWPLIGEGYLPYNLVEVATGKLLPATWWVYFAFLAAVAVGAAWLCQTGERRGRGMAVAASVLAVHLALLAFAHPALSARERKTRDWIMKTWEPTAENVKQGLFD